jgi:uncharacterized protein (TIGR02246 family)
MTHDKEKDEMSDRLAELEARVRGLEDREAIHALFMRYRECLDTKDFGGYAALFAEDGEFVAAGGTATGRAGIEALVDGMRGSLLTSVAGDDLHIVVNPEISVDGDRATARSTWIYLVRGDDGEPTLCKVGHYEDELIRENGTWLFARRFAPMDMAAD